MKIFSTLTTKYLLLAIGLLLSHYTNAQVTIGSGDPSVNGALLDLKEKDNDGGNSTRGLIFPRVELTTLDDLNDVIPNSADRTGTYKKDHIGLVVYNTSACCGATVWTGEKWTRLFNSPDGSRFTDSLALVILHKSTGQSNSLTNWGTRQPLDKWAGITVENKRCGRVTKILIPSKGLNGTIPAEISHITKLTELNLSGNKNIAGNIPSSIGDLKELTLLNLSDNKLDGDIPSSIGNLTALTTFNLTKNQLVGVPKEIVNLRNITALDISNNKIISLPEEIGQMTHLTSINFTYNLLTAIPKEIANLDKLTLLDFTSNEITSIPNEIGNMPNLTEVNFSINKLTALPSTINGWIKVKKLTLTNNPTLQALPSQLGDMIALENLAANNCDIRSLPDEIQKLNTKLGIINLSDNPNFAYLFPIIGKVSGLRDINLNNCGLTDLPGELNNLKSLTTLDISRNPINNTLPDILKDNTSITNLTCIGSTVVGIKEHNLTSLPNWFGVTGLTKVISLSIPGNNFPTLPDQLQNLPNLRSLSIYSNSTPLLGLKPWFIGSNFTNLASVNMGTCGLTRQALTQMLTFVSLTTLAIPNNANVGGDMPVALGNISGLTSLSLNNCGLTGTIPTEIGSLTKLKTLSIQNNALTGGIPATIDNLTALTSLDFTNNSLSGIVPAGLLVKAINTPLTIKLIPQNGSGFTNYPVP